MQELGMRLAADRVGLQLANALNTLLPPAFTADSSDGFVHIRSSTNWVGVGVRCLIEQDGDPRAHLFTAAYNVLNSAQDVISEELRWPWPLLKDDPEHIRRRCSSKSKMTS